MAGQFISMMERYIHPFVRSVFKYSNFQYIFDFVPSFYLASMLYLFNPLNNQFNIHVIRLSSNGQTHSTCVRSSSYYVLLRHSNR